MPSIDDIYEDNAPLKAEDLRGKDVTLTIKAAEPKTYDDGDRKLVLRFHKASRTLPLNRVNARTIADMHGGDFEQGTEFIQYLRPKRHRLRKSNRLPVRFADR